MKSYFVASLGGALLLLGTLTGCQSETEPAVEAPAVETDVDQIDATLEEDTLVTDTLDADSLGIEESMEESVDAPEN